MKLTKEGEELVRVSYRLPPDLIKRLQESALANRRSINDEVIVLLEKALAAPSMTEHFDKRLDQLESRLNAGTYSDKKGTGVAG